jgi:hypothetical protein
VKSIAQVESDVKTMPRDFNPTLHLEGRHAHGPQHVPWRIQIDRTSKPESQAGGRAGDSERQCHPASRPTREGQCEGQPTDATDIDPKLGSVGVLKLCYIISSDRTARLDRELDAAR